jgi:Galactose binding lectin domain
MTLNMFSVDNYSADDMTIGEFCNGERFQPRCPGSRTDVIVILSARYGRMNFGRCIEQDPELASMVSNPRFIGCSADVKHILDQQCSGLSECEVRINNQNFDGIRPCIVGLHMYLEASYTCLKGRHEIVY